MLSKSRPIRLSTIINWLKESHPLLNNNRRQLGTHNAIGTIAMQHNILNGDKFSPFDNTPASTTNISLNVTHDDYREIKPSRSVAPTKAEIIAVAVNAANSPIIRKGWAITHKLARAVQVPVELASMLQAQDLMSVPLAIVEWQERSQKAPGKYKAMPEATVLLLMGWLRKYGVTTLPVRPKGRFTHIK